MRRDYKLPVAVVLLLYVGYVFFVNFANLEGRRQLQAATYDVLIHGHNKSKDQLISEILDKAQDLDVGVSIDDVDLNMRPDPFGNQEVRVKVDFVFEWDMVFFTFDLNRDIEEEVRLMDL